MDTAFLKTLVSLSSVENAAKILNLFQDNFPQKNLDSKKLSRDQELNVDVIEAFSGNFINMECISENKTITEEIIKKYNIAFYKVNPNIKFSDEFIYSSVDKLIEKEKNICTYRE